jgi:hypothetical protein
MSAALSVFKPGIGASSGSFPEPGTNLVVNNSKTRRFIMKKNAIQLEIGCSYTDYETIIIPLSDNLAGEGVDTFRQLKASWMKKSWGYYGNVQTMQLCNIPENVTNPDDTVRCSEFDIYCYREAAMESDLYSTPYDESPDGCYFSGWFARDCQYGTVYSKDFAYFQCPECGRDICQQNPANGWDSQMRYFNEEDGEPVCTRCFDHIVLEQGINEHFTGTLIGNFFTKDELAAHNWQEEFDACVGSGHSGYSQPDPTIERIEELIKTGVKVLIAYKSMAIGGMGGYITVYVKAA